MTAGVPQFGRKLPGRDYPPRPGAYAIVFDAEGLILVVEEGGFWWLPGGGLEAGETPGQGLIREMLEETGYAVELLAELGRANEFTQDPVNKKFHNKLCVFFGVRLVGQSQGPRIAGNRPFWISPEEAMARLYDETHRWAVRGELEKRRR
ncbi:MAG: NUDIX domain-containing protein [Rhodospirillales bacterium]